MSEEIRVRPENLPPLAKDLVAVVNAYKRIKKLGPDWEAKHMARGLIYAGELLNVVGPQGGAVDRAVGLLEWLAAEKRDFDLGSAGTHFGAYQSWMAAKTAETRGRCRECGESYWVKENMPSDNCGRH